MDFGIFYEIQVNSPLKHREREYQVFHEVLKQVDLAEQVGFSHFWTVEHHFQTGFAHSSDRPRIGLQEFCDRPGVPSAQRTPVRERLDTPSRYTLRT